MPPLRGSELPTAICLPPTALPRRVVADARGDFAVTPGHLDAHAAEASVARRRRRRVVERVLVAQLVGDLGVDAFERAEALRAVEPAAGRARQRAEVLLARVEHAQAFAQVADAELVETHRS